MSGNQGKANIFKRLLYLWTGRFPVKEVKEESVAVRGLKRQLAVCDEVIEHQSTLISDMSKRLKGLNETNSTDKMLDMAKEFLMNKAEAPPSTAPTTLNYGHIPSIEQSALQDFDDTQIASLMSQYPSSQLKGGLAIGKEFLIKKIKADVPSMSEKSLLRTIEMIGAL